MRALFTSAPAYGHLHNLIPLANELSSQGHEVAFATSSVFAPALNRLGYPLFPSGYEWDGHRKVFDQIVEDGLIDPKATGYRPAVHFASTLAPKMLETLPAIVDEWQPDIIIRDPLEFSGALVAEMTGRPHATVVWAYYFLQERQILLWGDILNQIRYDLGLATDPDLAFLNQYLAIDSMPPSWHSSEFPRPKTAHSFRVPPFDQSGTEILPNWIGQLPYPKTVSATLGTTFNEAPNVFKAIIEAFRDEDINLIVTVGRTMDPEQFGPQPNHIRIVQYIPQTLLFPHLDAVIFHGGYNTLITALTNGLPVVAIPQAGGDQMPNSKRCEEMGVGIMVPDNPPSPVHIRDAVRSVLGTDLYRRRAQILRMELEQLPAYSEAVNMLETLVDTGKPLLRNTFQGY